ncbi:ABC transporter substrate-binding protein [Paenibacillus radicis (ex Gao et al. 2016)]|uniref:Ferrichrome ABC transporter substrate-binding protein n=1 Tax=Paenibacillus radicis (ex Gao et al. 2016) TaxID=1737354 RepID=A0A917LR74_9BACL|nr:iron-siderophore ABC transporter substrate-binding protein [Paenibacillus radicis (ex Gao et al. 2016)]GGG52816.1 ferrichrome ABC transporter substrate-binding protein [Paenibacillus radicis (ex Gao et al. 2016)]
MSRTLLRTFCSAFIIISLLVVATACGKANTNSMPDPTASPEASPSTSQEAAFTFKDTKGEQTLDKQPARIATTVTYLTDHMIALGLTPASTVKSQNQDFPLYLKPFLNQVDIIGEQGKVDFEKLLDLQPDLIITDTNSSDIYDKYAKIAPTAILENGYVAPDWQTAFRATGAAFGLEDKAEQVIQDYGKHMDEAIAQIHDKVAGKTLMVLRIRNDIRYYGDMDYKWLYDQFGFSRPAVFPVTSPESRYEVLSKEILPEVDPDYILLINDNDDIYSELTGFSLWKNLKAVKNDQVYSVASDSWFGGYGPNAANSMIDDLVRLFAK